MNLTALCFERILFYLTAAYIGLTNITYIKAWSDDNTQRI